MAFRGNPNAGAADPQFLNFLFSRQNQKAKEERQLALDRLKAGQQLEEEKRKRAVHEMDMAQKQFKLLSDIKGASAGTSADLQAISGRLTSGDLQQPQGATLPTDQSFASIMQQNDPAGVAEAPQNDQALSALNNDASQLAGLRRQVTGQDQQSALSDVFGQATTAGRTEQRERDLDLNKVISTEDRQVERTIEGERRAKAQAIFDDDKAEIRRVAADARITQRQADADVNSVKSLVNAIDDATEKVANATTPGGRAKAQRLLEGLEARKRQRDSAMTPESLAARNENNLRKKEEHRATTTMRQMVRDTISRPELLGPTAALSSIVANLGGLATELTGQSMDFAFKARESGNFDTDEMRVINSIFVMGKDPDTQTDIELTRLNEMRLVWVIENILNPNGRTAIREIENIRERIKFTPGLVSAPISVAKLRAVETILSAGMRESRLSLEDRFGKGAIEFADDDVIIDGRNLPPLQSFSTPQSRLPGGALMPQPGSVQGQPGAQQAPQQPDPDGLNPTMFQGGPDEARQRASALRLRELGF